MRQRPVSPPAPSAFESPDAPDAASRSAQGSGAPPVARPDKNEAVSTGADKVSDSGTSESLACRFVIENPGHRIVSNEVHSLDLSAAAARFVWMISGNNRLADIEFHDPIVKNFTDDEIIVPGSSYGTRIRQAHPGIDQSSGAIAALREDPNSRRAAISICQPTVSTRYASKDMPCALGMFFHAREGALHTQLVMRSKNAATLLPFNLFEFSLLAEAVASECGLEMGPYSHYAASMHIHEKNRDFAEKNIRGGQKTKSSAMPKMPIKPNPDSAPASGGISSPADAWQAFERPRPFCTFRSPHPVAASVVGRISSPPSTPSGSPRPSKLFAGERLFAYERRMPTQSWHGS